MLHLPNCMNFSFSHSCNASFMASLTSSFLRRSFIVKSRYAAIRACPAHSDARHSSGDDMDCFCSNAHAGLCHNGWPGEGGVVPGLLWLSLRRQTHVHR